jgi:hypothetical protein
VQAEDVLLKATLALVPGEEGSRCNYGCNRRCRSSCDAIIGRRFSSAAHSSAISGTLIGHQGQSNRLEAACNESGHQWPSVIISSTPRSSLLPLEAACPHTLAKEEGGLDTALLAQRGNRAHAASRSGREEEGEAAGRSKRCEARPAA